MNIIKKNLVWPPIHRNITNQFASEGEILLIISPYIKLKALKAFLEFFTETGKLKIIVKWSPDDIISGVSDLSIYPFLKERNVPLYIHSDIHLKLYIYNSNTAFHTSANITSKGLGYSENANIEIGCNVSLTKRDWANIYKIVENSYVVDDEIYKVFLRYFEQNKNKKQVLPKIILPKHARKDFSLSSLPASKSPEELWAYYSSKNTGKVGKEAVREFIHDLTIYNIRDNMKKIDFLSELNMQFKSSEFINKIIDFIKDNKSCRFGAINNWVHKNCSDVPLPYKWEIKHNVNHLYNWLSFFYDEITWSRPTHSQVIYWNKI